MSKEGDELNKLHRALNRARWETHSNKYNDWNTPSARWYAYCAHLNHYLYEEFING